MRKKILTFITLIMSAIICATSVTGCSLITTDTERDMNQVVASVQITSDAPYEEIQKRDMIMGYLNYGYQYEQYYGYTREQVFTMIINNLVQTRVYVQNAMAEFEDGEGEFQITLNTAKDKWDIDRYLTDPEIIFAEYSAKKSINDLITNYEKVEDEEKQDTLTDTVRAVPTGAANAEKEEPTEDEQKNFKIDVNSSTERRKAYNKVINLLEVNNLLGDYDGNIETTGYFKDSVVNYKESKLLEKYENCIKENARKQITFQMVENAYANKYDQQSNWTNADFVKALSSATASDPILVNNGEGYGYVYNLLLGASSEQTDEIGKIDKNISIAEKNAQRKLILDEIKVKDLRSSWILSGYDFDGEKFTGDYTFTSADNSLEFKGVVEKIKDATDEKAAEYKINSLTEYKLADFVSMMEEYVYGETKTGESNDNVSVYKKVESTSALAEYDERINELLFAFSTDDGSLNTYKGYAIKPIPDGGNAEEYMQEFADAGRELLNMGGNSYIMVATDYGYHVMFYSQKFTTNYGFDNLTDYLNSVETKDWAAEFANIIDNYDDYEDTDSYLYLLTDSIISVKVANASSDKQRKVINKYIHDKDTCGVTWYKDRYADLLA